MTLVTPRPAPAAPAPARRFESVYRVVTIVASHPAGWTEAASGGIAELAKTITDLRVARVVERDTLIRYGRIAAYRVKLQVSFRIDARRVIDGEAVAVRRCLVVANETVSSPALAAALANASPPGRASSTSSSHCGSHHSPGRRWWCGPGPTGPYGDGQAAEAAHDKARKLAEARLSPLLEELRAGGVATTWETSFEDPCSAAAAVVERAVFDEIVVSTLPAGVSRWLRLDLPRRLRRRCGLPVTVVESRS